MDQAIDEYMNRSPVPAVVAGIWEPERGEWITARGWGDVETREEMDRHDLVRIGSITKEYTAKVMLRMVDEGKIHLLTGFWGLSFHVAGNWLASNPIVRRHSNRIR